MAAARYDDGCGFQHRLRFWWTLVVCNGTVADSPLSRGRQTVVADYGKSKLSVVADGSAASLQTALVS